MSVHAIAATTQSKRSFMTVHDLVIIWKTALTENHVANRNTARYPNLVKTSRLVKTLICCTSFRCSLQKTVYG